KSVLNALWRKRLKRMTRRRDVAWLSGACLMTRRRALERSGGFDEDFFLYFEDIDLCRRIRKAGFRAVFFPGARVFHAGGASASAAPLRNRLEYRRSQLHYYRKHASRISRWLLRAALNVGARLDLIFRGAGSEKREFARALLRLLKSPERTVPRGRTRVLEVIDKPFLGGGQKTVLLLAGGLDRREFDVSVCSAGGGPLARELEKLGVRHFPLPLDRKVSPGVVRRLRKLILEESFDIVHTHGGVAGLYGRLAARRTRAAVVHTLHGIHYLHYRRPLLRKAFILLERLMSRATDAVVCVSLSDRDAARRHKLAPDGKLRIIKNGIDFRTARRRKKPGTLRKELRPGRTGPVVGAVARLHRQKGLVHFLRAVPAILKAHPRVRVVIAGGGPLRDGLEEEAARLGVRSAVLFLGERPDAADILGLLDVFVLPSLWEGLPYVLGEAAHAGRPIVATDIEGTREVLRDGVNGLLVPPADPEALALAVNLLLGDAALRARLASAARKTVPGHFDLGRMLRLTGALYRELKTNYNLHP
ncbi:MAG: glycosyltransferase, partial [Candidatus Aminicenantes bacterium]|nr:glycosyltransferase [Candidatus Aminicenantes bacterium]